MSVAVGCIGGGNIVRAILSGVEKSGVYPLNQIGVYDISQAVCDDFKERGYTILDTIEKLVRESAVVVVAVTPQVVDSIMDQIKKSLSSEKVILSIAAGISIDWYQERLGKNVATVYIRPQRYTKEFVDAGELFTISFFGGEHKKELGHLGSVSGRDQDKIKEVGFHVEKVEGQPTFEESNLVLICKKLYEDNIKPECFKEAWIDEKWYPNKDYSTLYIAEIVAAYKK